jgi:HK97 family phage portal protein
MSNVIKRMLSAALIELRSSLENPQTPLSYPAEWLLDIFNGGRTDSGVRVSEMTALQVSTVLACVNIISNGVASLPFHVYERQIQKDGRASKKVAYNHPLYELLHSEPNCEMSSVTFRRTLQTHCLLWGNGYCEIQRSTDDNSVVALWPRNPARTRPVRLLSDTEIEGEEYPTGTLVFEVQESMVGAPLATDSVDAIAGKEGQRRIVLAEDMIHLPGLSLDGRLGQPTIQLARQVIGLALATEKYGAKFFGNNARPSGILTTAGTLTPTAIETLRRSWAEAHGGENTHKTAVLENGLKYEKIGATPEEGQMLESREFQRTEIAAIFGVPGHMVGDTQKAAGKSTVEQSSIEFVLYCLQPWLCTWEHELKRKLFKRIGRSAGKNFAKFDTRTLLYPDAASRTALYNGGKQWGYFSTNDVRDLEDLNPISGPSGDQYWRPLQVTDADLPIEQATTPAPGPNDAPPDTEPEKK